MMNRVLPLALKTTCVCLVVYLSVDLAFANDPTPAYEKINTYLETAKLMKDERSYAQLVHEYLRSETEKGLLGDHRVVFLLNNFVKLIQSAHPSVELESRCSSALYEAVELNLAELRENMMTRGRSRLLDRIIYKLAFKRAQDCQLFFTEVYERVKGIMDPRVVGKVNFIMGRIIKRRLPDIEFNLNQLEENNELLAIASQALYNTFVLETQTIGGPIDAEIVYSAFGDLAHQLLHESDKLNRRGLLKASEVEEYYEDHLWEPCDEFATRLGIYVFDRAREDALILPKELGPSVRAKFNYYYAWAQQRLCQVLINRPESFNSDLVHRYVWPSWVE